MKKYCYLVVVCLIIQAIVMFGYFKLTDIINFKDDTIIFISMGILFFIIDFFIIKISKIKYGSIDSKVIDIGNSFMTYIITICSILLLVSTLSNTRKISYNSNDGKKETVVIDGVILKKRHENDSLDKKTEYSLYNQETIVIPQDKDIKDELILINSEDIMNTNYQVIDIYVLLCITPIKLLISDIYKDQTAQGRKTRKKDM